MNRLGAALNFQHTQAGKDLMEASYLREKAARSRYARAMWTNPRFAMKSRLQGKLHDMLAMKRDKPTVFGCSSQELREHFRQQFKEGWTFENWGKAWEIDHVVPLARFSQAEMLTAFHYTNLRPRSCALNRIDGYRIKAAGKYL